MCRRLRCTQAHITKTTLDPWSSWALFMNSSRRKLRKEKDSQTHPSKRAAPLQSEAWASGHCKGGRRADADRIWRFIHPLSTSVAWRTLCRVVMCV